MVNAHPGPEEGQGPSPVERRNQVELLSRMFEREGHVVLREPDALPSHLHNVLFLDQGENGAAGLLLARALEALAGRTWLRLTNRPRFAVGRSALHRVLELGAEVTALASSGDGRSLASAGENGTVQLWDWVTGRSGPVMRHDRRVTALAWSPDAALLASGDCRLYLRDWGVAEGREEGVVRLWDPATGAPRGVLGEQTESVTALAWAPEGHVLASSDDDAVLIWDIGSKDASPTVLEPGVGYVKALAWSTADTLLVLGSTSGYRESDYGATLLVRTLWSWDSATEKRTSILEKTQEFNTLAWSPDRSRLAFASSGGFEEMGETGVWDRASGECIGGYEAVSLSAFGRYESSSLASSESVLAMAWAPDGGLLALGSDDNVVRLRTGMDPHPAVLRGHTGAVTALAWHPDGSTVASGSTDGTIRVWDPSQASADEEYAGPSEKPSRLRAHRVGTDPRAFPPWTLAWSPGGETLASSGKDCVVRLWDAKSGEERAHLYAGGHKGSGGIDHLAWCPDGVTLASADRADQICLWDMSNEKPHSWLPIVPRRVKARDGFTRLPYAVESLCWSPDGNRLAVGGDERIRIWDRRNRGWALVKRNRGWLFLDGPAGDVELLAWAPDGRTLATGDVDSVHLWNLDQGRHVGTLEASDGPLYGEKVRALAWSPDGRTLAVALDGGVIHLWDSDAGQQRPPAELACDVVSALALAWSPDSRLLASGAADGTVRVWDAGTRSALTAAVCLSPVRALRFADHGRVLQAADNGASTANRPIPYIFEVRNVDIVRPTRADQREG